tara:strand:- start:425 stop:859 length:435 start_codon:yes stop_codon:yes gene_type:complete
MSKDDNYGFKGNAPDNPKINQMISFLYVGVAALNDGVISDNEIIQMVKKHISYGMEKEDAFRLLDESIAWWNDAKGKDVHFEDLVQCAKHIKNHQAWNENLKEMVHIDLTSITTADGLNNLDTGEFIGEHKLKVVNEIMKLFEN